MRLVTTWSCLFALLLPLAAGACDKASREVAERQEEELRKMAALQEEEQRHAHKMKVMVEKEQIMSFQCCIIFSHIDLNILQH